MKTENMFTMTKSYLETALRNFELFQNQNEKMVKLYLEQMTQENKKLDSTYTEWRESTNKAFDDYRDMITKGLDYLADCLEKTNQIPKEATPGPEKSKQNNTIQNPKKVASKPAESKPKKTGQTPKEAAPGPQKSKQKIIVNASTAA